MSGARERQITSCFQIDEALIASALEPPASVDEPSPRERIFALLDRIAEIAGPRQGAAKLLLVLARVAACDWVDGQLEVRVTANGDGAILETWVDDGLSLQRLRPPLAVRAPYEELARAVSLQARLLAPLQLVGELGQDGFVLRPDGAGGRVSIGPVVVDAPSDRPPIVPKAPPVPRIRARTRPPEDLATTVRCEAPVPASVHDAPTKPPPAPSHDAPTKPPPSAELDVVDIGWDEDAGEKR